MRIALIDASKKNNLYPLGLMKIASWQKDIGNEVTLYKDHLPEKELYDEIYVSTLFTFEIPYSLNIVRSVKDRAKKIRVGGISASLLPQLYMKEGVDVHTGLLQEAEHCSPDYSILGHLPEYSITHTSRGCIRKCPFCMVPVIEGKFIEREEWDKDIHKQTKRILFYDNNYLAKKTDMMNKDLELLQDVYRNTANKSSDFNQAIDCRLLTKEKAKIIRAMKIDPVRFAFDGMQEDGYLQEAVKMMVEEGTRNFTIFCLYNFEDTPEDFYYRMKESVKLSERYNVSIAVFPMRYQPILEIDAQRNYTGRHWTEQKKKGFMNILNKQSIAGQVSYSKVKDFEYWFTESAERFDRLLSYPKINTYMQKKKGERRLYGYPKLPNG